MLEQLEAIFDRLGGAEGHLKAIKAELLRYYNSDPCEMSGEYKQPGYTNFSATAPRGPLRWALSTRSLRVGVDHLDHSLFGLGAAELHVES